MRQDYLDEVVWREIVRLLEDRDLVKAEIQRRLQSLQDSSPRRRRIEAIERELIRNGKGIAKLLDAYQEGLLELDELRQRVPRLRTRERALKAEQEALQAATQEKRVFLQLAEQMDQFLAHLREKAQTLTVTDRQKILHLVVKEIQVGPQTLRIKHCIPWVHLHRPVPLDRVIPKVIYCVRGVISPLLANIVLNQLDWALDQAGFHFARYAADFVVLTRSERQAQEALELVQQVLATLQLKLSPEKTRITTFGKGYEFLGFFLSSRSRRMRDKSQRKFKDKVRELTVRCHNLDAEAILKLNRVIRGTAQYFAPEFATNRWLFQKLDSWVRLRLRSMKLKRKNYNDNRKLRVGFFCRKLGLLTLESFCLYRNTSGQVCYVVPRLGATSLGSPGERPSRR